MIIRGNTVGTNMPRTDWNQTDPSKSDYLKGRDALEQLISNSMDAAGKAQDTADAAIPKSGGTMSGALNVIEPTEAAHAASKGYVDGKIVPITVTLPAGGWQDGYQTVSAPGVSLEDTVIVSPEPGDGFDEYAQCGVRCVSQASGSLTFRCQAVPDRALTVNVAVWRAAE